MLSVDPSGIKTGAPEERNAASSPSLGTHPTGPGAAAKKGQVQKPWSAGAAVITKRSVVLLC